MHGLLEAVSTIADETILPESHPDGPRNTSTDDVTLIGLEIERLDNWKEAVFQPRDSEELSEKIRELYQVIRGEWRRLGFESPGARLRAMLEEALVNAWEHGNGRDPDKSITVRRRYGNDFSIEIADQGDGFDYEKSIDPTLEKNLTKPHGRGLFIIQNFCNRVEWKDGGRRLIASFSRRNIPFSKRPSQPSGGVMDLWSKPGRTTS
ncbi:MAG: ATP-binding protein [Desulfobacterales bacterium]|nr:ATP-binding protein [Desulfobacterales bacterium]